MVRVLSFPLQSSIQHPLRTLYTKWVITCYPTTRLIGSQEVNIRSASQIHPRYFAYRRVGLQQYTKKNDHVKPSRYIDIPEVLILEVNVFPSASRSPSEVSVPNPSICLFTLDRERNFQKCRTIIYFFPGFSLLWVDVCVCPVPNPVLCPAR